ncbi:hypothetical protein ARMSODRAFT_983396 [Armillaria solidipes]|uniref:Uncharacterized protein n=1 Tax=Armillaria solidipes TaxID=1076256 RepID=A0A2H3AJ55_9AGAR|nr:hypothetical protein ARMSODRAFT_983396 [Armillaria solidipes]
MTEWSTMIVWKQDEDNRARCSGPRKRTRREDKHDTRTRDQNTETGTQPERKHRNHNARERKGTQTQENENGIGKKRFSKARETREKEAHDEPERPAQTANLVGEILDELFAIVDIAFGSKVSPVVEMEAKDARHFATRRIVEAHSLSSTKSSVSPSEITLAWTSAKDTRSISNTPGDDCESESKLV